ncbi:hypothetical protein [Priestia megaterium]|uniref:hypothetical protein n=1 Tax=Priestia megaterium TaxID=1404 RepID=UPI003D0890AD
MDIVDSEVIEVIEFDDRVIHRVECIYDFGDEKKTVVVRLQSDGFCLFENVLSIVEDVGYKKLNAMREFAKEYNKFFFLLYDVEKVT